LLDQVALSDLLPLCQERGVAVIAGGVFNSGILARPASGAPYNYEPAAGEIVDRARRIESVCARFDVPLKAAALQFPLAHPAVACVLTGCRSVAELEENIRLFELELPAGLWPALKAQGLLSEPAPVPAPSRP
jgi:D-threo-aldose 1-dehydrogenase